MMEEFITLNHLEDDMREWMPDLTKFKEKHAFLSNQIIQLNESENWVDLSKLTEDCLCLKQLVLESQLMVEFSKLKTIIDWKNAQAECAKYDNNQHLIISNKVSKINEQSEKELVNELRVREEEYKGKAPQCEQTLKQTLVCEYYHDSLFIFVKLTLNLNCISLIKYSSSYSLIVC